LVAHRREWRAARFVQDAATASMPRLTGFLLACLFLVAPSADALCKATCTPVEAARPSCHEIGPSASADGHVGAATTCQRDPLLFARPGDLRRDVVSLSAPAVSAGASLAADGAGRRRLPQTWPVPTRTITASPRSLVLRI
jgi:hypothetical protein